MSGNVSRVLQTRKTIKIAWCFRKSHYNRDSNTNDHLLMYVIRCEKMHRNVLRTHLGRSRRQMHFIQNRWKLTWPSSCFRLLCNFNASEQLQSGQKNAAACVKICTKWSKPWHAPLSWIISLSSFNDLCAFWTCWWECHYCSIVHALSIPDRLRGFRRHYVR